MVPMAIWDLVMILISDGDEQFTYSLKLSNMLINIWKTFVV